MLYNLYLVSVLFSPPSLHAKVFYRKLFTLVSFIFSVPQAKTIVMNGKTAGQFNTAALAVNYVCFFHSESCMPPLEVDDQMRTVRRMMQAVSLKART